MARTFSFDLAAGQPCLLLTITRLDEIIVRKTTWGTPITIGGFTWTPQAGLQVGSLTERNDGTPPSFSFSTAIETGSAFDPLDIDRGQFEDAALQVDLTNAANPLVRDFLFDGLMRADASYDMYGSASFEAISNFAVPRDIFVRIYQLLCDADFGDHRCKVPTLPADVVRNETIAVGDARRFRFDADDTPEDYRNVYLEATSITTGITAGSAPAFSSTVSATTVDGGVTWTTRNALARAVQVAAASNPHNFTLDRDPDPRSSDNEWYHPGTIIFRSGYSINRRLKIGAWRYSDKRVTTFLPICHQIAVGDWAEIIPDCDHTIAMCVDKYANPKNHRGFPYQSGAKQQALQLGF